MNNDALVSLTDQDLCDALARLASDEQHATARLVAMLAEMDRRRLFLALGYGSLFAYCTEVLHLAEGAAYTRIEAARSARRWPLILDLLADGSITLASVRLLAPHLTDENHRTLLSSATHKSKREVEQQMAALRPLPAVPSSIRKLPAPTNTGSRRPPARAVSSLQETTTAAPAARTDEHYAAPTVPSDEPIAPAASGLARPLRTAIIAPLAPERFRVQFTMNRESYDRLKQAQDLLRHVIPNGDPAAIFERALRLLLVELQRKKLAETCQPRSGVSRPTSGSRHIPSPDKRKVWNRDGGRCAFVGHIGRCAERGFLEFHHVVPFSDGGPTTASNLSLRCRAHNQYESEAVFGPTTARKSELGRPESASLAQADNVEVLPLSSSPVNAPAIRDGRERDVRHGGEAIDTGS